LVNLSVRATNKRVKPNMPMEVSMNIRINAKLNLSPIPIHKVNTHKTVITLMKFIIDQTTVLIVIMVSSL
jgi:hypothetical protein